MRPTKTVWKPPRMDLFVLVAVVVVLVIGPLMTIAMGMPWPFFVIIVAFILVFETVMYWLSRTQLLRDIWYSQYRMVDRDPDPSMDALETALREAGFPGAARRATARYPNWRTIDVGNGLNVTWMVVPGESDKLHVGPDRKGTHGEVERVKGVVDALLARSPKEEDHPTVKPPNTGPTPRRDRTGGWSRISYITIMIPLLFLPPLALVAKEYMDGDLGLAPFLVTMAVLLYLAFDILRAPLTFGGGLRKEFFPKGIAGLEDPKRYKRTINDLVVERLGARRVSFPSRMLFDHIRAITTFQIGDDPRKRFITSIHPSMNVVLILLSKGAVQDKERFDALFSVDGQ